MLDTETIIELPSIEQPDAWDAPVLFDEFEAPDIPARCLSGVLGAFAQAIALSTETPEALSVMTLLGVLSTVLAK